MHPQQEYQPQDHRPQILQQQDHLLQVLKPQDNQQQEYQPPPNLVFFQLEDLFHKRKLTTRFLLSFVI